MAPLSHVTGYVSYDQRFSYNGCAVLRISVIETARFALRSLHNVFRQTLLFARRTRAVSKRPDWLFPTGCRIQGDIIAPFAYGVVALALYGVTSVEGGWMHHCST